MSRRWYRAGDPVGSGYYLRRRHVGGGLHPRRELLGKPIFPGSSTMNQLEKIADLVGCKERLQGISPFAPTMIEGHEGLANNGSRRSCPRRMIKGEIKVSSSSSSSRYEPQGAEEGSGGAVTSRREQRRGAEEKEEQTPDDRANAYSHARIHQCTTAHTHRTPESRAAQPSPPLPTYANAPPPPACRGGRPRLRSARRRVGSNRSGATRARRANPRINWRRESARGAVASSLDQKKGEREQNLKRQQTLEARFRNFFKVRATSAPPHLVGPSRMMRHTPPPASPIGSFTPTKAALPPPHASAHTFRSAGRLRWSID